jgi:hypothetical protein
MNFTGKRVIWYLRNNTIFAEADVVRTRVYTVLTKICLKVMSIENEILIIMMNRKDIVIDDILDGRSFKI